MLSGSPVSPAAGCGIGRQGAWTCAAAFNRLGDVDMRGGHPAA
jgi:hypothetical protein